MSRHADILICGTGLVGLATALGLARAGLRPCLLGVRRTLPRLDPVHIHPRVYALSPPAQQFLQRLGVWGLLDASRITAVHSMQVHGDAGGSVVLHGWQRMQAQLAWIVEADALEHALRQALSMFEVDWVEESFDQLVQVRDGTMRSTPPPVKILTTTGRELPAQLVIGADGAHSALRQAAGIACREHAYDQLGLVANLSAALPHMHTACQWFDQGEILALLPLPDLLPSDAGIRPRQTAQVSMVWSMERARAQALLDLPAEQQAQRLQTLLAGMTGNALGVLGLNSDILSFPLTLVDSDMISIHSRVALVGDAAHRIHPLAGQGLNLGLGDVEHLLQVLREKPLLASAGDASVLRRYRRARAHPVWAMRTATDGLQRLFASNWPAVVWGRNLGMHCVEHLPWLKQRLIAAAANN